jgi:transposase-like protein
MSDATNQIRDQEGNFQVSLGINTLMKCPICQKENLSKPIKQWNFATYEVSRFVCSNCGEKYNIYTSGSDVKFTIPR